MLLQVREDNGYVRNVQYVALFDTLQNCRVDKSAFNRTDMFLKFTHTKFNVNFLKLQIGYGFCLKLFCRQVAGGLLFETDIFLKFTYRKGTALHSFRSRLKVLGKLTL